MESRMGARERTLDLAKGTPKFAAKREEDPGLRQRIKVLATLAIALLREVEDLRSIVTNVTPNCSREVWTLDAGASVRRDHQIDFYKEVERYEIDLIKKALRHTGGEPAAGGATAELECNHLKRQAKELRH
jgi:hypothetical protein